MDMYPRCVHSFKFLLVLTVLIPAFSCSLLLNTYSHNYEGRIVRQCEREVYALAIKEKIYTGNGSESVYLESELELEEYEIKNIQRIFECISSRILGPRIRLVERTPECRNLTLRCNLHEGLPQCDSSYPYRTFDGTCNNLQNVKWGSIETCIKWFIPQYYEGVSGFRRSVCGIPLPNPRILSLSVFKNVDVLSEDINTLFIFFAQLVSHDVSDILQTTVEGEKINCCSKRFLRHPQCAPIRLPPDDPFYSKQNVSCMHFVRNVPCKSCSLGKRNAVNRVTSFIDCSAVYGLTEKDAKNLRRNDGTGKMLVQETDAGDLLPLDFKKGDKCGSLKNHEYCFEAGDRRVNQHTILAALQTIFVREHNRIAGVLKQLNPRWGDEKLYQETRKIVIAEFQVIVYKEFLPLLVGREYVSSYNLGVSDGWTAYNTSVDPTAYGEFLFGPFKLHSVIPTVVTHIGVEGGKKNLSELTFESAAPLYHGEMENLFQGMCGTSSGMWDLFSSPDITESLLRHGKDPGIDLLAVDIQRTRDAGMAPYTEVIRYLSGGRKNIETFEDLETIFHPRDVQLLKSFYRDPQDIDFFVGMHLEPRRKGSVLWGSPAEIVARQFSNLKFGDRFFFEHFGNFNKTQLDSLKQVTLAKILCENTNLAVIPQNAMKFTSGRNPLVRCEDIPKLNLNLWRASPLSL